MSCFGLPKPMWEWTMMKEGRSVTALAAAIAASTASRSLPSATFCTFHPQAAKAAPMSWVKERSVAPAREMRLAS